MSRFYFHLTHSEDVPDTSGVELDGLHSAKCHAVKIIADALCESPDKFWDADSYRVTVSDSNGLILLSVEMISTFAPVLMPASPRLTSRDKPDRSS